MKDIDRRAFLDRVAAAASAALASGLALRASGAQAREAPRPPRSKWMIPREITITRIDARMLQGTRPRVVGRNARLGVHGRHAQDPIVRLHTDAGTVGWGWCRARRAEAQRLVGKKLHEVFDPGSGTNGAFLAFDFPLWDLAGRVLGRSVHAMLGDAGRSPVPVYDGSIYFDDLEPKTGRDRGVRHVLDGVKMGLDAGFRAFKAKIGRGHKWMERKAGFARDVAVLHAIRNLAGKEGKLLIDANNGYSTEEARELMRQAGDCGIYWFEEPFPENKEQCVAFRKFIRDGGWKTLIADGEGSRRREVAFTEIVRAGGIDVVQFDLRGYTLTRWRRYLRILAETKTLSAPHNWGSHLAGYYIAQFGRGCPRFAMGEIDTMRMPGVRADGYKLANGLMTVPDSPGFGLALEPSALKGKVAWTVETD